ncbi:MAG: ISRSO5-transposase protein, partial [Pseudonocardiales bacterium]|nr:ISRSO5-transposase protein [Pseudonocardiales bacterium]
MVMWLVGTATVTTQGLTGLNDTTNEEWGLLSGHNWGPRLGHQWVLFHGHGHATSPAFAVTSDVANGGDSG